jgi:hypothetical protein
VTLPEPELADGALAALVRPLLLLVLELLVLELPDAPESELPELAVLPAVLPAALEAACTAPGSANATAPAASTLATPAVAVTARSRACP